MLNWPRSGKPTSAIPVTRTPCPPSVSPAMAPSRTPSIWPRIVLVPCRAVPCRAVPCRSVVEVSFLDHGTGDHADLARPDRRLDDRVAGSAGGEGLARRGGRVVGG